MPGWPVMAWGSVSRGVHRRSIELRNHRSRVPTLLDDGEGNMSECAKRLLIRFPGVRDLRHVHKLHEREPGDLGRGCCIVPETVRPGKVEAEIPACALPRSRTGQ
jgi:hypothetical protein